MAEQTPAEIPEQWQSVGKQIAAGVIDTFIRSDAAKATTAAVADGLGGILGVLVTLLAPIGIGFARGIAESEDAVAPALSEMAAAAVKDMFGVDVPESAFRAGIRHGSRRSAADALGAGLIDQLKGPSTSLEPSDAAAAKYLTVVVNMALEGWYQKWFFEFISSLIPQFDIGKIENFGSLDDKMAQALGLGRLTRRVLSPIIDASVVTPLRWQTNKTYRPELLGAGDTARQILRGRWTPEKGREELARQGFSDDRIEALLNAQRKFFSVADVRQFIEREHWTREQGIQHLREQGYEEPIAIDALRLGGLARIEQIEAAEATLILQSYANYEIGHGEFVGLLRDFIGPPAERALLEELGELRRRLNIKHLASPDVARMVEAGILSFVDYRRALEREGYTPEAVAAKELFLRWDLDKQRAIEEHRHELEEARRLEREARELAQQKRREEIERERALTRRGAESDLEDAAVRGLIPFARVEEIYRARYDDDTVAILVAILEERRDKFLDDERRRQEAEQRAARRELSIGDVEQAVLEGILTIEQYRTRLEFWHFDAADVDVLTRTLAARKAALDAATRKRADAEAAAKRRGLDLGRFERLVRLGLRTRAQYAAFLRGLGFEDAAIAAIGELLDREIADDRKADDERQAAEAAAKIKGLSVEEFRRAVLLELSTRAQFEQFMIAQGYTSDRQRLFLRELDLALAAADAARRKREEPLPPVDGRELPLSTVARAARLGVVAPDTYLQRLARAGYSDEDAAIETELLVLEIADVQAARRVRDAAPAPAGPKELALSELARAVRAGLEPLEAFRARAISLGFSREAVDTQVRVLGDELRLTELAKTRREQIGVDVKDRGLALAELEEAVIDGTLTIAGFVEQLVGAGVAPDDAELLAGILIDRLEAAAA